MRYIANLEGDEHELEINELAANALRLRLGGQEFDLDVRRAGPASVSILIGERAFDFDFTRQNDEVVIASRGLATRVTLTDTARRGRAASERASATGRVELKAMMPGRVVNLLVKDGDQVEAHQGVIIVEAMKMENELKSPRAGKVTGIKVAAGQTVEKGAVLLIIE